jgi:shikimate dehydrogenase
VIGAVNTVYREGDRLIGTNTDGKGFLRGLRDEAHIDPKGKRVAVLGAGGAARAITFELAFAGARELTVINRSVERSQRLAEALRKDTSAAVHFVSWSSTYVVPNEIDILVNATSIGLYPAVDALPDVSLDQARSDLFV